jgi:hypothetical protein
MLERLLQLEHVQNTQPELQLEAGDVRSLQRAPMHL